MPNGFLAHALRASCRKSSRLSAMAVLPLPASIFVPARSACYRLQRSVLPSAETTDTRELLLNELYRRIQLVLKLFKD